jgi:glycopeptide antibiotics resistance protein
LVLVAASVVLIVAATTMPWSAYYVGHSHWAQVEWVPFSRLVRPDDFLLNILLFMPFGFSVYLWSVAGDSRLASSAVAAPARLGRGAQRRRIAAVVGAAVLLSTSVELFQVYCHGRLPTTTDILSNAIGAFLAARWAAARMPSP